MSPEAAERLQELIEERDSKKKRVDGALRDEMQASYGAMAIAAGLAALVVWGAVSDAIPWIVAVPFLLFIAGLAAVLIKWIRTSGLTSVTNAVAFFSTSNIGEERYVDDPIEELRERLAECERRIVVLRQLQVPS